jgi:ABC transport system ATP-binding/permease protein
MALIDLLDVSLAYGASPLLQGVNLRIDSGERVCLLGRNGTGKSTLMRLIHGVETPDRGEIERQPDLRTALLQQEVPPAVRGHVGELVASAALGVPGEEAWEGQRRMEAVLRGLGLDADARFAELSGGLKRRVFLARALVQKPDLLLLDEPTNHLDIGAITWLEEYLLRYGGSLLFVTHDRMLLGRLATRIVEIDRGALTSYPGDHASYLRRKEESLSAEESQRARFDQKLAEEEVWIRKGVRARRRRNEGRVRALVAMREEHRQRREQLGSVRMHIQEGERSGKIVAVARGLRFGYDADEPLVDGLDAAILRGDRLGLIGPNGVGKTTLLKLLLGQLEPLSGGVRLGSRLEIAYLDQLRGSLRNDWTVAQNVADGADSVHVDGKTIHVISWLRHFLFEPERSRSPIDVLSGGERNRLLLARLFARPSNVLVLDEPTNDLDADTLDLLEERLLEYRGTVLVVSHDRAFLDNVVTSTLVFEGSGRVVEYAGGYSDWLDQRAEAPTEAAPRRPKASRKPAPKAAGPRKLTYAERLELAALPDRIEQLEGERDALQAQMAEPAFYKQGKDGIAEALARLERTEEELETVFARWGTLEELS